MRTLAALITLAVLLPSCQVVSGMREFTGTTVTELGECGACVDEGCATERAACLGDRGCRELYTCVAACRAGDPTCRRGCERAAVAAADSPTYRAVDGCRRIQCTDECYGVAGFGGLVDARCACADDLCAPFLRKCIRSGELRSSERIGDCERLLGCFSTREAPLDPDDAISCMFDPQLRGQPEANLVRFCWQNASCGQCPLAGGQMTSCAGAYKWSGPMTDDAIAFQLTVIDQRSRGLPAATVRACLTADCDACLAPVAEGTTDGQGVVTLQLPVFGLGFRGCFQIDAAGMMPATWYVGRPVVRSESLLRLPVYSLKELETLGKDVTGPLDPLKGQVVVTTRDCIFTPARGMTLEAPGSGSTVSYLRNGEPTRDGPTDETGAASVTNVAPGPLELVLRMANGTELSRATVRVRAGALTGAYMLPLPFEPGPP